MLRLFGFYYIGKGLGMRFKSLFGGSGDLVSSSFIDLEVL